MKKNVSLDRTKFCVILDTNILRQGIPINKDVESLISDYLKESRIKVKCYVPELVKLEFEKYCKDTLDEQIRKHNTTTDIINKLSGGKNDLININDSKKLLADILRKNRLNILITPYKKITIPDLITAAVNRTPPFEEKGEKGFKDRIIADTVLEALGNWAKVKVKRRIAFVSDDRNLREYIDKITGEYGNFSVYESLPSFVSELKLYLSELDDKFISELTQKAKLLFYEEENPECLYIKDNIQGRILKDFSVILANPSLDYLYPLSLVGGGLVGGGGVGDASKGWERLGKSRFELSDPVFTSKQEDNYVWESTVQYRQSYRRKENNYWSTSMGFAPIYDDKDYLVEFVVRWSFKFEKGNILSQPRIIDLHQTVSRIEDTRFLTTYLPPTLKSGATITGQGTIPVQEIESSYNNQGWEVRL